jgi:hypothetical protein
MESERGWDGLRIEFLECEDEDCKKSNVVRPESMFGRWRHVVHERKIL